MLLTVKSLNGMKLLGSLLDIVKELREFSDLEVEFGSLLQSIEDCTYKDLSSYNVKCFLKCVSNVEKITQLATRVKSVKSVLQTGKEVGDVAITGTGVALKIAVGEPYVVLSASKQVLDTGAQAVTVIKQSETVSQTFKIVSFAADSSDKVVKTKKAVQLVSNTLSKETVTITTTLNRIGLGLGVVFAAVYLYQIRSAIKASKSKCDITKELQSCMENIEETTGQVMSQVDVYKEVMKIKVFFENSSNKTEKWFLVNQNCHLKGLGLVWTR